MTSKERYSAYLWNRMQKMHDRNPVSGHTPGHKNGLFLPPALKNAWGELFASYDYTELDGLDNLHFSSDCILESQKQAAKIFGAKKCFYLVNGTTAGLQAAILAACSNRQVFVPRHVHRSVYHGLLLAHAEPIYLPIELDEETSLPLGVKPEVLQEYIQKYPSCHNLVLVNPTYQGITKYNTECVKLAKSNDICVIVDEAHGSHLHFHDDLPASMIDAGADLVVQSWHKTLPVLTQGSALLVGETYNGPDPEFFLSILQTTSPSYLLMASLEAGSIHMGESATEEINASLQNIYALHKKINSNLKTMHVMWKDSWKQDPFKLYLLSDRMSGEDMETYLREEHALYCEMHDNYGVLLILPVSCSETWTQNLYRALSELDTFSLKQAQKACASASFYCREIPKRRYPLHTAFYLPKDTILWKDAAEKTAGAFILRYPPGIPLVVPGEVISREIVDLWIASGGSAEESVTIVSE